MKAILFIALLTTIFVVSTANKKPACKIPLAQVPTQWITMVDTCTNKIREQIQAEISAAMTYMAMGAHFSRDKINRPGFAETFFKAATEEREHAIKLIEYLLLRGDLGKGFEPLIRDIPKPQNTSWTNGFEALTEALRLETKVTRLINGIIKECENAAINDYHVVDYLTEDFLGEQYRGQRDLAGKASTLGKMIKKHGALGEFLFDKKLLYGEL
ncbi:hypothetical protein O3M35_006445 [Rhynocoris fuscipes]|uniref:Ferritin n=1 Tax=Rhynocoris fuscipes TaxID=488301 RepID=A0AAW1DFY0_9HEMI